MTDRRRVRTLCAAFLLFAAVVVVSLTMVRASLAVAWYAGSGELHRVLPLLLVGLRFDLALVGALLWPAILLAVVALLGRSLRRWARVGVVGWLVLAVALTLIVEAVSLAALARDGRRPDLSSPSTLAPVFERSLDEVRADPVVAGFVLAIGSLIVVGLARRLQAIAPLRDRLPLASGSVTLSLCAALASVAWISGIDASLGPLDTSRAPTGAGRAFDELAVNGLYRLLLALL